MISSFLINWNIEENYDQMIKNITVLDALSISSLAYTEVAKTVKNCFQGQLIIKIIKLEKISLWEMKMNLRKISIIRL